MIVYSIERPASETHAVVLLGSGLVGSALAMRLVRVGASVRHSDNMAWDEQAALARQIRQVFEHELVKSAAKVDVIWAAGACGFGATAEQTEVGKKTFRVFVDALQASADDSEASIRCHLMSSAGGLFEGAGLVSPDTRPVPARPYGFMKLWEEQVLSQTSGLGWNAYRLASVYGPAYRGARLGLVSALVTNTLARRETLITGRLDTLRDYVWVHDIADFVVDQVCWGRSSSECYLMASGRPTSIAEVLSLVARVCRRKPLIRCVQPDNAANITFAKAGTAPGFRVSDMAANVFEILRGIER